MKFIVLVLAIVAIGDVYADNCDDCCMVIASVKNPSADDIAEYWANSTCHQCGEYDTVCGAPSAKSGELTMHYIQKLAQDGAPPQQLAVLANLGSDQSTKEMIKTQLLASIGLPIELVHYILMNMEFSSESEEANTNALIRFLASSGTLPPAIIPLLLNKDENAEEFYLISMIESGEMDPLTGLLTLAENSDNFDKDDILDILVQTLLGGDIQDLLAGIIRPYLPKLPEGVFPGDSLYFAHFESLGVNTCALHDLRNRYECGYAGIAAADCEISPYCCYSPVFMTDVQASDSSEGAITAASAIPWCYYNVFFVFTDSFALTVKQIGEFAAPLQCPTLWKYNLGLDDSYAHLLSESSSLEKLANEREECGFPGITQFHCVAIRGCCWDAKSPLGVPQCFQPKDIPTFDADNIPDAYKPVDGVCNVNKLQIPVLYFLRKPATYPLEFHKWGFDVNQKPTRMDCLTRLAGCWEENEEVVAAYPDVPRCYQRSSGTAPVGSLSELFVRSGAVDIKLFPPHSPPTTTPPEETTAAAETS